MFLDRRLRLRRLLHGIGAANVSCWCFPRCTTSLGRMLVTIAYEALPDDLPGIWPSPPTRAPTPKAPFLPNSTATSPKGSSRDGIRANSAPEKIYGGNAVNSGFEYTRPGYAFIIRSSLIAANFPYKSITGPIQINCVLGCDSRIDGKISAMRSIPFCMDHLPTNTNKSAFGSSFSPAHFCASIRSFARPDSIFRLILTPRDCSASASGSHFAVSVGSGFGSEPMPLRPQKMGYRAYDRWPYLRDTPTAPKPF